MKTDAASTPKNLALAFILLGISLGGATVAAAHSFPRPDDPELKLESTIAAYAAARNAAVTSNVSEGVIGAADSVASEALLWPTSSVTVCFWNGKADAQQAVIDSDKEWEGYAGLSFSYTDSKKKIRLCSSADSADVRISLDGNDPKLAGDYDASVGRSPVVSWSLVGREANFAPKGKKPKVTVNLPEVQQRSDWGDRDALNFFVRHELGHARGLLHEHQRQECSGWFNIDEIAKSQNWTTEQTKQAVDAYEKLPLSNQFYRPKVFGGYDVLSIMQYNFLPGWYLTEKDGKPNPCLRTETVTAPSPGDKATLVAMYPRAIVTAAATVGTAGAPLPAAAPAAKGISQMKIKEQAFKAKVANERQIMDLLKSQLELDKSLAAIKKSPDIETFKRKLPPTSEHSSKATEALDRLEKAVADIVNLEARQ
jgi:hypothetical protein